jgi:uncharacterized C2H2 Zn-finger protein
MALALCASFFAATEVSATPTISLSLTRTNGYSWGNDINGHFSLSAHVSSDVVRVEFYLDDALQFTATGSSFSWAFDTNDYPLGQHNITAVAYDSAGQQASSSVLSKNFVEMPVSFYFILILVVGVAVVISVVAVFYARKKSGFTKCPNCGYVFRRQYGWIHLGTVYRNICPKCGKGFWAKSYDGPIDNNEESSSRDTLSEEERLKRDIEDSKYEKQ